MKTLSLTTLTAGAISALLLSQTTLANNSSMPATFNFDGNDISHDIQQDQLPKRPLNIAVYCQSTISAAGKPIATNCFNKEKTANLEEQIESIINKLSFNPASVNGENVPVRMNYRVVYQQDELSQSVLLIPNLGSLQAELGVNYSEPQELIAEGWFNRLEGQSNLSGSFFEHNHKITRAAASITTKGKAQQVTVIDSVGREKSDLMANAIKNAQFIPGQFEGKTIEMKYLAIVASK